MVVALHLLRYAEDHLCCLRTPHTVCHFTEMMGERKGDMRFHPCLHCLCAISPVCLRGLLLPTLSPPLPFCCVFFSSHLFCDGCTHCLAFWGMMSYFSPTAKPYFLLPVNVAESHLPPNRLLCLFLSIPLQFPYHSFIFLSICLIHFFSPSFFRFALTVSLSLIHSVSFCLSLPLFCSCLVFLGGPNLSIGLHLCPRHWGIPSFTSSVSLH